MMTEMTRRSGQDASSSIPTMFLMAHMQMDDGDTVVARRCLQSAVKELGHQAGVPVKPSVEARSGMSGCETTSPYALRDREWLILAIQTLLNNDLESCLLWVHQADRRVFDSVVASECPRRLRLTGDLHAVLACAAVQAGEMKEAEKFLATAYERHAHAEAFPSVCRDLILTSRLAILQGQSDRAQSLLDAAECQLVMALTPDVADRSPLMSIIHSDRMQIADTFQQIRQVGASILSKK